MSASPQGPQVRGLGVAGTCVLGQLAVTASGVRTPGDYETLLFLAAPIALATTMVLWLTVVARGGGRAALACAIAAALSLAVPRLGVTVPLAGAALVLGRAAPLDDPAHERSGWLAVAAAGGVLLATALLVLGDVFGARGTAAPHPSSG